VREHLEGAVITKVRPMNSKTLRLLWSVVEQTQANTLLGLNDTDLVTQLLRQLDSEQAFSREETNSLSAYIFSRTTLIRDLAMDRGS
jgi:5'-deoxynucleotidase YfbR-like HD superfamily hydrolase